MSNWFGCGEEKIFKKMHIRELLNLKKRVLISASRNTFFQALDKHQNLFLFSTGFLVQRWGESHKIKSCFDILSKVPDTSFIPIHLIPTQSQCPEDIY